MPFSGSSCRLLHPQSSPNSFTSISTLPSWLLPSPMFTPTTIQMLFVSRFSLPTKHIALSTAIDTSFLLFDSKTQTTYSSIMFESQVFLRSNSIAIRFLISLLFDFAYETMKRSILLSKTMFDFSYFVVRFRL